VKDVFLYNEEHAVSGKGVGCAGGVLCLEFLLPILLVPDHNANKGRKKDGHSGQNDYDQTDGEKRWPEKGSSQGGFQLRSDCQTEHIPPRTGTNGLPYPGHHMIGDHATDKIERGESKPLNQAGPQPSSRFVAPQNRLPTFQPLLTALDSQLEQQAEAESCSLV
jgi:hypothetical protein